MLTFDLPIELSDLEVKVIKYCALVIPDEKDMQIVTLDAHSVMYVICEIITVSYCL
jgi:hypothetical protein